MTSYRTYCFSLTGWGHAHLKRRAAELCMTQSEFIRGLIRADLTQPLPPHPESAWHSHHPHHPNRHPVTSPSVEDLLVTAPMA